MSGSFCTATWHLPSSMADVHFASYSIYGTFENFSKRENPCKYILIYACKLLWSNIWYWMCERQNMFENDRFFVQPLAGCISWPHQGLPRCNFAALILKGSAFVSILKQSLEVSLQNVHSIDLTVRKQIQKKFTQHPMISVILWNWFLSIGHIMCVLIS